MADAPLSKDEKRVKKFIDGNNWIFAKTYAKTFPHEYIVYDNLSPKMKKEADWFMGYIKFMGVQKKWFRTTYTYLYFGPHKYWSMAGTKEYSIIINRDLATKE